MVMIKMARMNKMRSTYVVHYVVMIDGVGDPQRRDDEVWKGDAEEALEHEGRSLTTRTNTSSTRMMRARQEGAGRHGAGRGGGGGGRGAMIFR